MPKDLRAHPRFYVFDYNVNGTLAIVLPKMVTGIYVPIKDISQGGVCLYSKVRVDTKTKVRFSIEDLDFPPLNGHVVWCRSTDDDKKAPLKYGFRLGIEFEALDDSEKKTQAAMIQEFSRLVDEESKG